jgi:hypothetical protein
MSDEQRKGDETEVEGHFGKVGANDEPAEADDESDSEVEAHIKYPNVRMD